MSESFILKGDICQSLAGGALQTVESGYLVCENGVSRGVFADFPERYRGLPVMDHSGRLLLPGLVDLHVHAPQFAFRSLGMDLELIEWLNRRAFPEEAKYRDLAYAGAAYRAFVDDLVRGATTRACVYATLHVPATLALMDALDGSGLVTLVGKVNMDRNSPPDLTEKDAAAALADTEAWVRACAGRYGRTAPILTPRFIPSCSDELMYGLADLRRRYGLPVQSHLSENPDECAWVRRLCPNADGYADAYARFGLLSGEAPVIMAHCVYSGDAEIELLRARGVYVAHCPQSNTNIASGIAPVRRFLSRGLRVGLGSDVAGGCHTSVFRAMVDAISVSKLRYRLVEPSEAPLKLNEAFFLATRGGGACFGKVGAFDDGYEFDALVVDDAPLAALYPLPVEDRLSRVVYLSDERHIVGKYVRGKEVYASRKSG